MHWDSRKGAGKSDERLGIGTAQEQEQEEAIVVNGLFIKLYDIFANNSGGLINIMIHDQSLTLNNISVNKLEILGDIYIYGG